MKEEVKSRFQNRYYIWLAFFAVVVGVICYRLVCNTMLDRAHWEQKAVELTKLDKKVTPARGKIFSSDSSLLATNVTWYYTNCDFVSMERIYKKHRDSVLVYLPVLCDSLEAFDKDINNPKAKTAAEWEKYFNERLNPNKKKKSERLFGYFGLTYEQKERLIQFPFSFHCRTKVVRFDQELKRFRPFGTLAARSVGGIDQKTRRGSSGIEGELDSLLYGVDGIATPIQYNNKIGYYESQPSVPGYDIMTTIDLQLQDIVYNELEQMCIEETVDWATAVVMEVKTGEIKAICNLDRTEGSKKRGSYEYFEGQNRALQGVEPGSVVKPISMMIALEEGITTPERSWNGHGGKWNFQGKDIRDSHPCGSLTANEVIEKSSNIGMAGIILHGYTQKSGKKPSDFRKDLEKHGFFEPLNLGLKGEQKPRYKNLDTSDSPLLDLSRMAFGYTTFIPPIYTLAMYNAFANDGLLVAPHLVKKLMRKNEPDSIISPRTWRVCSEKNAKALRYMLHQVVWGKSGTAGCLRDDRIEIAGKTGTCRVCDETTGYKYAGGVYRYAFCGFFPYEQPKYSCIVVMQRANHSAARSSGTVLKNIALKMYARGMIQSNGNYKAEGGNGGKPTLYAAINADARTQSAKGMKISVGKQFGGGSQSGKGIMPSVIGLGFRDAIHLLESHGLRVHTHGVGYVYAQSLAAGAKCRPGETVELNLKTR